MQRKKIEIEYVPIESIRPAAYNPRDISPEELAGLKESILKFGEVEPLVFNERSGILCGGHQRLKVFESLGYKEVPIVKVNLGPTEEKALNLALNTHTIQGKFNPELVHTLIDEIRIEMPDLEKALRLDVLEKDLQIAMPKVEVLEEVEGQDDVPEVRPDPIVKKGDLFELGRHRLLCGDSTMIDDVEKLLNGNHIGICFTSPPYADQREYNGGKDLSLEKLSDIFISDCDVFCVNLGLKIKDGEVIRYWDEYIKKAEDYGYKLAAWNVWDKGTSVSLGNMRDDFILNHEWIFVFSKKKISTRPIVKNKNAGKNNLDCGGGGRARDSRTGEYGNFQGNKKIREFRELSSIISVTPDVGTKVKHPAKFPVNLPSQYLEAFSDSFKEVYEPFCGSGSTLIASEKTGYQCFGIELDPRYCQVIIERYLKFTSRNDVYLIDGDNKIPWEELIPSRQKSVTL